MKTFDVGTSFCVASGVGSGVGVRVRVGVGDGLPSTSSLADKFEEFINELNKQLLIKQTSLNFRIDKASGSVVVQVVESESGKVIRQIPPESILAMRGRLQEMTGIMLDTEI